MRPILALALKALRLLARNRGDLFFTLGFPLLIAVFFGVIFSGPSEGRAPLGIAVVDADASDGSRAFVTGLEADPAVSVLRAATAVEAEGLVRLGKRVAYLVLPPGFGAASARPFGHARARLEIGLGPSRKAEGAMLEGLPFPQAAAGGP